MERRSSAGVVALPAFFAGSHGVSGVSLHFQDVPGKAHRNCSVIYRLKGLTLQLAHFHPEPRARQAVERSVAKTKRTTRPKAILKRCPNHRLTPPIPVFFRRVARPSSRPTVTPRPSSISQSLISHAAHSSPSPFPFSSLALPLTLPSFRRSLSKHSLRCPVTHLRLQQPPSLLCIHCASVTITRRSFQ